MYFHPSMHFKHYARPPPAPGPSICPVLSLILKVLQFLQFMLICYHINIVFKYENSLWLRHNTYRALSYYSFKWLIILYYTQDSTATLSGQSFSKSLGWLFESLIYYLFKCLKDILQISNGLPKGKYNSKTKRTAYLFSNSFIPWMICRPL